MICSGVIRISCSPLDPPSAASLSGIVRSEKVGRRGARTHPFTRRPRRVLLAGRKFRPAPEEVDMPFVSVKVIEGVFDDDRKRRIVEEVTEAMVRVEGEAMRPVTWVVLEEVKSGDWCIGGRRLTTEDVRAMAGATPVG
jgi:4-oxalocrotonate tautomerase